MTGLDRVLPNPRLREIDAVELAAPPSQVWARVRHGELFHSPLVRALFGLRSVPMRLLGKGSGRVLQTLDEFEASGAPGFRILIDDPPNEVVVGALGKVWSPAIPFRDVREPEAFARFVEPGLAKVAWAMRVRPWGERDSRLEIEVRVDVTDEQSWPAFRRYFTVIGPASRFIRRSRIAALVREFGTPQSAASERPLPGDEFLPDARGSITHGITLRARPGGVWPWLAQLGCLRGGFYSIDALDNGGVPSAREIHPEWQKLEVGDRIPATPEGQETFEVLRVEPGRQLVLGGLYDADVRRQLPFAGPRPDRYWHVTWSFVLEALDDSATRLHVRARAAFPPSRRFHAMWIRPVHNLMQTVQLRRLAARAEDRLPRDSWRDVFEGVGGAVRMAGAVLTPFRRTARAGWGLDGAAASRQLPGDQLVPASRWSWTHGIEVDAPASEVWPWVAQLGADRAGFYSYQWLENLAGCGIRNAERIHPEWAEDRDALVLHPKMRSMAIAEVEPGRWFVAYAPPDEISRAAGRPWASASWLFLVEPLGPTRCRFVSRFRSEYSDDLPSRLTFGPLLVEPIGSVMDRRMLLGVKERAERARSAAAYRMTMRAPWAEEPAPVRYPFDGHFVETPPPTIPM